MVVTIFYLNEQTQNDTVELKLVEFFRVCLICKSEKIKKNKKTILYRACTNQVVYNKDTFVACSTVYILPLGQHNVIHATRGLFSLLFLSGFLLLDEHTVSVAWETAGR